MQSTASKPFARPGAGSFPSASLGRRPLKSRLGLLGLLAGPASACRSTGAAHGPARAPAGVLAGAKAVERAVGRSTGGPRFGPRLLDVDLLLYSDQQITLPGLTVPHPRLHRRTFALAPLADLAPGVVHPTLGVTVAELLGGIGTQGVRPVTPLTPNMCSW